MKEPQRLRRPVPRRTRPNRSILGALSQSDGLPPAVDPAGGFDAGDMHPLGPGFDDMAKADFASDPLSDSAREFIDRNVRSASDLIDGQIRQGQETAKSMGHSAFSSISGAASDLPSLLTGLVRAYSDIGNAWIEVVGALAQKAETDAPTAMNGGGNAADMPMIGLSVVAGQPVETSMELFRPAQQLIVQPLVSAPAGVGADIADVSFESDGSGSGGRIRIVVPAGQPVGLYHGLLLSDPGGTPTGAVTVKVLPGSGEELARS